MLKRFSYIKNLGVFKNYSNPSVQEFKKVNVIYGWNYSGKTTLSRLVQSIERKSLHPLHKDCTFKLIDASNQEVTESNYVSSTLSIRVFNSAFVEQNLKWDGEHFDPILLLGEEAIEAKNKLDAELKKDERLKTAYQQRESRLKSEKKDLDSAFTKGAGEIKHTIGLVEAFQKPHLEALCREVRQRLSDFILPPEQLQVLIKEAHSSANDKLPPIPPVSINLHLSSFIDSTRMLLAEKPAMSRTIEHLKKNPHIAEWIALGLDLHRNSSECEFCKNTISDERRGELRDHFSEDLKAYREKIQALLKKVLSENISFPVRSDRDFYPFLRNQFNNCLNDINRALGNYNRCLDLICAALKAKDLTPLEDVSLAESVLDCSAELLENVRAYNSVITKNNEKSQAFEKEKSITIQKLKRHFAAKFSEELKLDESERRERRIRKSLAKLGSLRSAVLTQISILEAKVSSAQKGRERINNYISRLLGSNGIRIEVVKGPDGKEKYVLQRGNTIALLLSEGEKTAISFSFFLTKLLELPKLSDTIVYIDDPISSLDSNHIFQINALIHSIFIHKTERDVTTTCAQLFISTHNFEFFSLMRRLAKSKTAFFHVRRIDLDNSVFEDLPSTIKNYSSEYHFLFGEILRFHNSRSTSNLDALMYLPNAVRRFAELYSYSRIPGQLDRSSVENRMIQLYGVERSKRIVKLLHHFSHSENIERMMTADNLISDIAHAIDDFLTLLKENDPVHFNALLESIRDEDKSA